MLCVSIVEDKPSYSQYLEKLINSTQGCKCIGKYRDAESILDDIRKKHIFRNLPDVILMDIGLPGISGIDCTRKLKSALREVDIIILTVHYDPKTVFSALSAGACGYIEKTAADLEIMDAIIEVVDGGAPISPPIARMIIESFQNKNSSFLTKREMDVLQCLCNGKSYKEIAGKLFISIGTVRHHIKNIYSKLHVHSKSEAVAKALKEKIVS